MDTDSTSLEFFLIFILVLANAVFAMSEIAIVSSRKVRLEKKAEKGSRGAKAALAMANEPTQMLSTMQAGISIIGIFTGAFSGATIAHRLAAQLKAIPAIAPYSEGLSLVLVVSIITYLTLIIGELVPKKIALANPEPIAARLAVPMQLFAKCAAPLIKILSGSTELVVKILGIKESAEPLVTEDEVKNMLEQGAQCGTFEKAEQDMVERIFSLSDMRVSALMTPRTQVDWLDIEDTNEQNLALLLEMNYSRFPVAKGSLDEVIGVVYTKDLLARKLKGLSLQIEGVVREPLCVPKNIKAFKVLEMFKQTGIHMAFVIDEYGGFLGLVTINDILEHIVGDIPSLHAGEEPEIVQRDDGSWLLDGMVSVEQLKELFNMEELPGEDDYQTLGGFIFSYIGYIPQTGEHFVWKNLRFEVMDMDGARIDRVLVYPMEKPAAAQNDSEAPQQQSM
ncbi:MAG: hemolysin family protein [Pelosinus sp.]|nr:hemolysin family protein [Pelosinus sp.]